jgi:hypothetical protein
MPGLGEAVPQLLDRLHVPAGPLMRSAPRPSPVLFQWVTTNNAQPACWQTRWMAWRTAPMSYRFEPLAPAAARYSGSRTTRAAGGRPARRRWRPARRRRRGRPAAAPGRTAGAGRRAGRGRRPWRWRWLDAVHRGSLSPFPQQQQHRAGCLLALHCSGGTTCSACSTPGCGAGSSPACVFVESTFTERSQCCRSSTPATRPVGSAVASSPVPRATPASARSPGSAGGRGDPPAAAARA